MAAAVADYRPKISPEAAAKADGKLRRDAAGLTLHLEPTPDLLAEVARARQAGQTLVGFALEPRSRMLESARAKLNRKKVDMIVANPLETMDGDTIEATVVTHDGAFQTKGAVSKGAFADWLLGLLISPPKAG